MRGEGGRCGASANKYTAVHRSPNKLDLTLYLTYATNCSMWTPYVTLLVGFLLHAYGARGYVGVLCTLSPLFYKFRRKIFLPDCYWECVLEMYIVLELTGRRRLYDVDVVLYLNITAAMSGKKFFGVRPSTGEKFNVIFVQVVAQSFVRVR
jgi:hypothetical protein